MDIFGDVCFQSTQAGKGKKVLDFIPIANLDEVMGLNIQKGDKLIVRGLGEFTVKYVTRQKNPSYFFIDLE